MFLWTETLDHTRGVETKWGATGQRNPNDEQKFPYKIIFLIISLSLQVLLLMILVWVAMAPTLELSETAGRAGGGAAPHWQAMGRLQVRQPTLWPLSPYGSWRARAASFKDRQLAHEERCECTRKKKWIFVFLPPKAGCQDIQKKLLGKICYFRMSINECLEQHLQFCY